MIIDENCKINGLNILIQGNDNVIEINENTTINASYIQPTTINAIGGKKIIIGKNSLLSNNIEIHTSDYHSIYDKNDKLINQDNDIIIEDSVWIGMGCKILKGSVIPKGCIVGASSVVTNRIFSENSIICGNPASIIKEDVYWDIKK